MADSIEVLRAALRYIEHTANGKQELLVEQMRNAIRALSPAGGDWVATKGDRALGKNRGASPQQEPGAQQDWKTIAQAGVDACDMYKQIVTDRDATIATLLDAITESCDGCGAPELLNMLCLAHDRLALAHESFDGEPDEVLKQIRAAIDLCTRPTPEARDPSGQTLAGAGDLDLVLDIAISGQEHATTARHAAEERLANAEAILHRVLHDLIAGSCVEDETQKALCTFLDPITFPIDTATSAGTTGDDSEDAARYRYIRGANGADDKGFFVCHGTLYGSRIPTAGELDAAIDAAFIAANGGGRED